jgi:hypothetical protein
VGQMENKCPMDLRKGLALKTVKRKKKVF